MLQGVGDAPCFSSYMYVVYASLHNSYGLCCVVFSLFAVWVNMVYSLPCGVILTTADPSPQTTALLQCVQSCDSPGNAWCGSPEHVSSMFTGDTSAC